MRQLLSGCFAQLFQVAILLNANSSNVLNTVSIKGPLKSGTNGTKVFSMYTTVVILVVTIQDPESQIAVYLNALSKMPCVPMPPI